MIECDNVRTISRNTIDIYDTERIINQTVDTGFDTEFNVKANKQEEFDTSISVVAPTNDTLDTELLVVKTITGYNDTKREVLGDSSEIVYGDTEFTVSKTIETSFDTAMVVKQAGPVPEPIVMIKAGFVFDLS
jgi:hypothetical protein